MKTPRLIGSTVSKTDLDTPYHRAEPLYCGHQDRDEAEQNMGGIISQRWIGVQVRTPDRMKVQVEACLKMYSQIPVKVFQVLGSPLWLVTGGLREEASFPWRLKGLESALRRMESTEGLWEPLYVDLEVMSVSKAHTMGSKDPVYVGSRLVVYASSPDMAVSLEGKSVLFIHPMMAFGDGRHPSTLLALRLLEAFLAGVHGSAPASGRVLDAGCGTGILSLAAAALGDFRVFGVDISEDAIAAARANQRNNGETGRRVQFVRGGFSCARGPFCVVIANLVAAVHTGASEALWAAIAPGGRLILSGFSMAQKDLVIGPYLKKGAEEKAFLRQQSWAGVLLHRPVAESAVSRAG